MVAVNIHLVEEAVRLCRRVVCHVLDEALIFFISKRRIEHDKYYICEIFFAVENGLRGIIGNLTQVCHFSVIF